MIPCTRILLLYDTKEADLIRDFKDLFVEIGLKDITDIPVSPDHGHTLEGKENIYFDTAAGAIFILTPGSVRDNTKYPSASVNAEMGIAKEKFKKTPEKVVYLCDKDCKPPAIDQKTYISFDRNEIRSVLKALTQLLKQCKVAGFYSPKPMIIDNKDSNPVEIIGKEQLSPLAKKIILRISCATDAKMNRSSLDIMLRNDYQLDNQNINFIKNDLIKSKIVQKNDLWREGEVWRIINMEAVKEFENERQKTLTPEQKAYEAAIKKLI